MKYLDEKLALLNALLVKENLSRYGEPEQVWTGAGGAGGLGWSHMLCPCRVLEALWELLLQAILQALGANLDVSADFYSRFHFTLEVGPRGRGPHIGLPGAKLLPLTLLPPAGLPGLANSSSENPPGQHFLFTNPPVLAVPGLFIDSCLASGMGIFPSFLGAFDTPLV